MNGVVKIIVAIAIAGLATLLLAWSIAIWIVAIAAWYVLGYWIIRENERAVRVILGDPDGVVLSGLRWAPFLIGKFLRYTTGIVELNFKRAGIITRKGKLPASPDGTQEDRVFGIANIGADVSFRFCWPPNDDDLIKCVRLLPSPQDVPALTSIFEEPILDHVRNAGGKKIWVELARDRKGFAEEVRTSFLQVIASAQNTDTTTSGNIIADSKIEDPIVAIAHIEIPEVLLASLTAEEVAQQEKAAVIIKAQAEKEKATLEGQGIAAAKKALIDAIGPQGIPVQALLTLETMAQGQATTIFPIPTDLMNTLGNIFGTPAGLDPKTFLKALTPVQKQELMQLLTTALHPGGKSKGGKK